MFLTNSTKDIGYVKTFDLETEVDNIVNSIVY